MTQAEDTDVVDQLFQDHVEVRSLFTAYETARTADDREELFRHIVHDLSMHETAEEEVVWPVVRTDLADGSALADARISEEEETNRMMAKLESLDFDGREFSSVFEEFRRAVLAHAAREEEDGDIPLVLRNNAGKKMIAEIPLGRCVSSRSLWKHRITAARTPVTSHYRVTTSWHYVNRRITLRGLGFFDEIHNVTGQAPNGIELHPVTWVRFP